MNQCIIIGVVKTQPEFKETANGNKIGQIIIEANRMYRNNKGDYDADLLQVTLWKNLAEECESYLEKGMLVAIRGRLQANNYQKEDEIYYRAEIIAERLILLQANHD